MAYSGVVTFVLLKIVGAIFPLRATQEAESEGLDTTQHGEEAYIHTAGSTQIG
jgi:Amt family ammonium transporter